ncbi:YicC/YloC family endoribonuclease [Hellea balneolensis]|uniref:YicC/YloC family endoribonuclease n=1 Tax=Hellea balneolensis TaxID=287478 RepID=UPI0003FB503E|nr:YicC/YloC family endoribonuclease [Hellea balneolensis]
MSKPLSGMTGFARASGTHEEISWSWEVRSVNGKSLDIRLRLPSDLSEMDGAIRKRMSKDFSRGNMQVSLNLQRGDSGKAYRINEALLDKLEKKGAKDLSVLMTVPGIIEEVPNNLLCEDKKSLHISLLSSFDNLCKKLKSARDDEGKALTPILLDNVAEIETHVATASQLAAVLPETLKQKLKEKFEALLAEALPEERLAQEAAMLAMKADVREELDRLRAHCVQARDLMSQGSPIGRKLEFLSQEFNRETNTLCAKSADIELTRTGLALKSVIEQFREQAANVE